ncbi:cobaltochelatase subunit CobN [Clostridium sp. LCP25S3_F10]|uniref:cobaltochelatase subunit CobN n=1 Tax=Clostridium sp. LCP25S3_F10 TaxID=3438750 RepID=UPI003F902050
MKKITMVMWHTYTNVMKRAVKQLGNNFDIKIYSVRFLDEGKEDINEVVKDMEESDLIFLYRSNSENVWVQMEGAIKNIKKPIVCTSSDPSFWTISSVDLEVVSKCYSYIVYGGVDNFARMITYMVNKVLHMDIEYKEPITLPWEGIYHPDAGEYFTSKEDYFNWYKPKKVPTVGLIISRGNWVNNNIEAENKLIKLLEEKGYNVLPVFTYSLKNLDLGTRDSGEVAADYFFNKEGNPIIDGLIKLTTFFLTSRSNSNDSIDKTVASRGVDLLKELGVPVFQPAISFYTTLEEWQEDPQGLTRDVSWSVALPEFEGVIEPIIIAAAKKHGDVEMRAAIEERCKHLIDRVDKWVKLAKKPLSERKIAFILHNNPCASVEATVGGGANLDTLESVARVMNRMKKEGYNVNPPQNGKELIDTIMDKKAISEFRWTTADEIVNKGGVLKLISKDEYSNWFKKWPLKVQEDMIKAWGNPPGEELNGVPAAMLYDGKIMVTGVSYGNTVVCIQPKRGCAGTRCDGQVCKILHDPDIPPTHQYLATYRYLEEGFGADVLVHVGTHGNLEFLPGKGVGLSSSCYPDIAVGNMPHLYIYNSDNPPEGTIAKRRSYAVLVNHMQTVLTNSGLYEELAQLDLYLEEYEKAKIADATHEHMLKHLIIEEIKKTNLDKQINIENYESFEEVVTKAHGILSTIRNTQIQDGQHIFGDIPKENRKVEFINSILKFDAGEKISLRKSMAKLINLDLNKLKQDQDKFSEKEGKSNGALLEKIDELSKKVIKKLLKEEKIDSNFVENVLGGKNLKKEVLEDINLLLPRIEDLNKRIEDSNEIEALLSGFNGEYIPAGPSGLILRGRDDVLPTGRNFYSVDPYKIPTQASYKVGIALAKKVLEKHIEDEGIYPENIAIQWMCNDIMWADGEGLAQMLYLIGAEPKWAPNGRVCGFDIISLEELKRPRIDLTVRVSGITRDNFSNCVDLLDEAIQAVAVLDEPIEKNFVRKHTLEKMKGKNSKDALREATFRIFASKPGTYQSGVNLAVYASAWKDEKDLADIFVYWNGYAYGKNIYGKEAFKQLQSSLKTVDITYNKVITDEHDLLGCCAYFGSHGGMTSAAKIESGKDVKTYYGDTRDPEYVDVRTLADEIRRVARTKLLNPKWIEGQKRHGYKGASDISKRVGRVYGWEATTGEVDDWIFDDITETFVSNEENRKFFEDNNPWALEEMARRLLEAEQRGLWNAKPEMIDKLKEYYIEIEGWLEEKIGDVEGEFQGGAVDIFTAEEVGDWKAKMAEIKKKLGD